MDVEPCHTLTYTCARALLLPFSSSPSIPYTCPIRISWENLFFIFHKSQTLITSICAVLKQFTKTICHYPLAKKRERRKKQFITFCSQLSLSLSLCVCLEPFISSPSPFLCVFAAAAAASFHAFSYRHMFSLVL